jgi:hypothetical protein
MSSSAVSPVPSNNRQSRDLPRLVARNRSFRFQISSSVEFDDGYFEHDEPELGFVNLKGRPDLFTKY